MKTWSVFSIIIVFHLVVIGLLLIQPGCRSQPVVPEPSITATGATGQDMTAPTRASQPTANQPLDPAFNAGLTSTAQGGANRPMREPTRPSGDRTTTAPRPRAAPDLQPLEPVLQPIPEALPVAGGMREYTVRAGDTLTAIARSEGVSLEELLRANNLNRNATIFVGQTLTIPNAGTHATVATAGSPSNVVSQGTREIQVQRGDTLSRIAQRNNTTVAVIRSLNNLRNDTILIGQTLLVPDANVAPSAAATSATRTSAAPAGTRTDAPVAGGSTHTVVSGDTLSAIAARHGTTVQVLMDLNGIRDARRTQVGQVLTLPSGAGTRTQPAAAAPAPRAQPPAAAAPAPRAQPPAASAPAPAAGATTRTFVTPSRPTPAPQADPLSELEALEDDSLPFVEVETVRPGE